MERSPVDKERLDELIERAQKPSKSKLEGRQLAVWITPKSIADRFYALVERRKKSLKSATAEALELYCEKHEGEGAP